MSGADNQSEFHVHSSLIDVVRRSRPLLLLTVLVAYILVMPIVDELWVKTAGMLGIVAASLGIATTDRRSLIVGLVLAIPASVLLVLDLFQHHHTLELAAFGFILPLFLHIIRLMLKQIFGAKVVTLDTIGLALCTYVLLGVLWVLFYIPVLYNDPASFNFSNLPDGREPLSEMIYFSYVTLTTLGYGDVAPVSPLAQGLAITEALTGVLFLAVLISRLVGAYSASRRL